MEEIDRFLMANLRALVGSSARGPEGDPAELRALFDAQLESRHLDLAARHLQQRGEGFYTIGSAGHEANAALGLVSRVDDPALVHYRSGGFFAARAAKHGGVDAIRAVLLGMAAIAEDPISGGRHKVFGHPALHVIPQTSTIASHLPRAVGLAYALDNLRSPKDTPWPEDAVVLCSFGDASLNHSTAQGALNAAAYLTHRRLAMPLLLVCEDNGLGISTRTPPGWVAARLGTLPGIDYVPVGDADPVTLLERTRRAVEQVRAARRPVMLHLSTVRLGGHAGSDVESAYRSRSEIVAESERDPILATARHLVGHGLLSIEEVLDRYETTRAAVAQEVERVVGRPRLSTRADVVRPLLGTAAPQRRTESPALAGPPLTLSQAINATLAEALEQRPNAVVFGEDVAVKGGVYGVTRGLRKRYGARRVFDTLLDEQTILGIALGSSLAGLLPIPEIQYLAYVHNAEDQLRGEAASLPFFSDGQYANPMVVRIAGLAYQKGFGGHFHNDNSVAVLRDVPGLVVCVPSHPAEAPALLRACLDLAQDQGRVCVFLEPIALYHRRDLHEAGDDLWTSAYDSGGSDQLGAVRLHGDGSDLLLVTFGNGVPMSLRAARTLQEQGISATVLDLRWLAPLPEEALVEAARRFDRVLVVDETRRTGGVGEGVLAALVDARVEARFARVASADSFVPLGPAADHVLLSEAEIVKATRDLLGG